MEWVIGIASVVLGLVCGFLLVRAFPGGAATKLSEEHAKATTRSIELDITLTKEREAHADKVAQLNEVTRERDEIRRDLGQLRVEHAAVRESLDQERKQWTEKFALLSEAKEQMKLEFKALAAEVMKDNSATFSEQNKKQVEILLNPLREHIDTFQKELKTAHHQSTIERTTLAAQIQNLTQTSSTMLTETANLTRALKGEAQTQGAWGQMILESILDKSGLRAGEEYTIEESHRTDDGTLVRTDVIVNLPNGQRVVIDSKVSLKSFDGYVKAEDEAERASYLKAHLSSLRTHIRELSSKEYHATAASSLDYVIMFVPIEGALAAALQEDKTLTTYAVENNVPIATPTTLMIALRTMANLWQVERRNRNAEAIADRAGKLYEKFVGFVGDLQKIGNSLDQAKKNYDDGMKKLSTGRGNIVGQLEQLKEMGAKTGKALPPALISEIEVESTFDDVRQLPKPNEDAAAE